MTRTEGKYILDDAGNPVEEPDLLTWGRWLEDANEKRIVSNIQIGDSEVSTVFLGLDHNFGSGPPLLFETMVFGGSLNDEMNRYATREEALAGHAAICEKVQKLQTEE